MNSIWNSAQASLPWLAYLILLIVMAAGLFLNILGLPGLWLIVIAVIAYAWGFGWLYVGVWAVGGIVVLAMLAELAEFAAGAAGSKAAGGSKRGMVGAIVGGILGGILGTPLIPIPIVGTIIGSVAGCFIGAYAVEWMVGRSHNDAAVISYGAAKGRIVGLVAKSIFGITMAVWASIAAIPFATPPSQAGSSPPTSASTTAPALPTTAP